MFGCCECCVLSGRGLCDALITRPEESYRLWRVVVCDQETSKNEEAKARYWAVENTTRWVVTPRKQTSGCDRLYISIFLVHTVCRITKYTHHLNASFILHASKSRISPCHIDWVWRPEVTFLFIQGVHFILSLNKADLWHRKPTFVGNVQHFEPYMKWGQLNCHEESELYVSGGCEVSLR
jgi:hypothetical protein